MPQIQMLILFFLFFFGFPILVMETQMCGINTLSLDRRKRHLSTAPLSVSESAICTFMHVFPIIVA